MVGLGEVLFEHLEGVDGGGERGPLIDELGLRQQSQLEVRVPATLPHPDPSPVHRHGTAHHEFHAVHVLDRKPVSRAGSPP